MAEQDGAAERSPSDTMPVDASPTIADESTEQHQPFYSFQPIRSSYSNSWDCAPTASDPVAWEGKPLTDTKEDNLVQAGTDMEQSSKDDFDMPYEGSNQQPEPLTTEQSNSNQNEWGIGPREQQPMPLAMEPHCNQNEWDTWPNEQQPMPLATIEPDCNIDSASCDTKANQFSFSFSYGRQPKYVGAGLSNMGNTCFLNATLQCITHTVPLVLKLRSINHSTPCSYDKDGFCSFCALKEHVNESIQSSGSVIMPVRFRDNLRNLCSDFRPGQQEDAHEFLCCLLDNLDKCTIDPGSKGKGSSFDEDSMVKQVFGGKLKCQLSCCECGHSSVAFEPFLDLNLGINEVNTLEDALKSFTKVEQIGDSDEKLTCEQCKAKVSKNKQLSLDKAPDVLALQLKRFSTVDNSIEKIDKHVAYPMELDLKPFHSNPAMGELKYDLYGVVEHSGLLPNYGHYVCTIRSSPSTWYLMNDSRVDSISDAKALNQEAYILFYVRQGKFPWFSSLLDGKDAQPVDSSRGASPVSVLDNIDPNCSTSIGEGTSSSSGDNLIKNESMHCKELEKDETSQCRSSFLPGEPSEEEENLIGAVRSTSAGDEISPSRSYLQDDTSVRYPCTMETNLDRPSTPPRPKRVFPENDFDVFDYVDFNEEEETPLMPGQKFNAKAKKTKAASASKAIKGSCFDQNAAHLMRRMPASRRKGLMECMPTQHKAKQESRRCPASDPLHKRKRKLVSQH